MGESGRTACVPALRATPSSARASLSEALGSLAHTLLGPGVFSGVFRTVLSGKFQKSTRAQKESFPFDTTVYVETNAELNYNVMKQR